MNIRKIFIIIIVILLIALGAVVIYYFSQGNEVNLNTDPRYTENKDAGGGDNLPQSGQNKFIGDDSGIDRVVPKVELEEIQAMNKARFFTEMMGSYSTETRFRNLFDLKPFMTSKMKVWADNFISNNKDFLNEKSNSVTTRVLTNEIERFNTQSALVIVSTRREEKGDGDYKVYNQEAEVGLIKSNNDWLLDSFEWQ